MLLNVNSSVERFRTNRLYYQLINIIFLMANGPARISRCPAGPILPWGCPHREILSDEFLSDETWNDPL